MTDLWWRASTYWMRSSERVLKRYVETNRALLAMFGVARADGPTDDEQVDSPFPALAYSQPDWTVDRPADAGAALEVGKTVRFTKEVTDADVRRFARSSGDTNRLHLDETFAVQTRFRGRIVHGTLLSGLISAALARLPGVVIYLSKDIEFLAPAHPGETLTAVCDVVEDLGGQQYRLQTRISNEAADMLVDGEVTVLIDDLPATGEAASP